MKYFRRIIVILFNIFIPIYFIYMMWEKNDFISVVIWIVIFISILYTIKELSKETNPDKYMRDFYLINNYLKEGKYSKAVEQIKKIEQTKEYQDYINYNIN